VSGHYDELALQDYLDDPESFEGRDDLEEHVEYCLRCQARLDELRAFDAALTTTLWDVGGTGETPEAIRALADLLVREDAEADDLLVSLLGSPASFRRANITARPLMLTAGVVRRLCEETRHLRERQPMHALVVADAAIAIADQLPPGRYPAVLLDELRGGAWLERANVLRYLGRHVEALDATDIASRAFARTPVAVFSIALVDYLRGVIYVETQRHDEALRLVRRSARIFRQFGENERFVHARMVEAAVLYDRSSYREARDLFLSLIKIAKDLGAAATLARLYSNVADCQLRLHELESAEMYFARALSLYEALGLHTERIRTRWSIGSLRIAAGDLPDGLRRLREARRELDELGVRSDAALVTLDLAEALLAGGDPEGAREAADLCASMVESFAAVGMTGHALTALAYLREALESGKATLGLIRHVRAYLESDPDHGGNPFLPPSPL
jgi:tetratricopeptide (TPR) repeat protein